MEQLFFGETNSSTEVIRGFTMDNTIFSAPICSAPVRLEYSLTPSTVLPGETITVLGSIVDFDAASDISLIDFWLYDRTLETWTDLADESTFNLIPEADTATFEYDLTVPEFEPGDYLLWARGYDFCGLFSEEVFQNFTVTDLQFSLNEVEYTVGDTLTGQGTVVDSDGGSNIARIDFWLYDRTLATWTDLEDVTEFEAVVDNSHAVTFEYSLVVPELASGSYSLWARGIDLVTFSYIKIRDF